MFQYLSQDVRRVVVTRDGLVRAVNVEPAAAATSFASNGSILFVVVNERKS